MSPEANDQSKSHGLHFIETTGAASLVVLPFWLEIFTENGTPIDSQYLGNFYFSILSASHVDYIAALLLTIVMGGILFIVNLLLKSYTPFSDWFIHLLCIALGINAIRIYFFSWLDLTWAIENLKTSLIGLSLILVALWLGRHSLRALPQVSKILGIPVLLIFTVNTVVAIIKIDPVNLFAYEKQLASTYNQIDSRKGPVIWIIFDELDECVGFRNRPADIEMPALDQFRSKTTVATAARPPGDVTLYSIPSLMLGKRINATRHQSRDDLWLIPEDGSRSHSWKSSPGIIGDLRMAGSNIAILAQGGHPYCRLFGSLINYCWENGEPWHQERWTVLNRIDDVAQKVGKHIPFVSRWIDKRRRDETNISTSSSEKQFKAFLTGTVNALRNKQLDFIFLHWNLPHRPFIYDRKTNAFLPDGRIDEKPVLGYLDNLELTDRAFAAMRRTLENSNRWDQATVIVSADHRWRKAEKLDGITSKLVPFMIKLPGQQKHFLISQPIDTIQTVKLIRGVFSGTIKSGRDLQNVMSGN